MTTLRTYSGLTVNTAWLDPSQITLRDVAHHLALINRFNGATPLPYSVAQHSVLVSRIVGKLGGTPRDRLLGLLHDAHEAYLGDMVRPLRMEFDITKVDDVRRRLDETIFWALGLPDVDILPPIIEHADDIALSTEWRDMMSGPSPVAATPWPHKITPQPWFKAEEDFLKTFERLQMEAGLTASSGTFHHTV